MPRMTHFHHIPIIPDAFTPLVVLGRGDGQDVLARKKPLPDYIVWCDHKWMAESTH